jgi:hypothetical protein
MSNWLRRQRFRFVLWRFRRSLPEEWKRLSDEEQAEEIRELVRQVRAERAARFENTATVTDTETTL